LRRLLQIVILLLVPVLLVLTNLWLMMTPAFPRWEYAKSDFPDPTIVPLKDRQPIVDRTLAYVKGAGDDSLIADMAFDDGRPVYNEREVHHLRDVRILVDRLSVVYIIGGLVLLVAAAYLVWTGRGQSLASALAAGAGLTIGLIGLLGLVVVFAFQFFFVSVFHPMFFEGTTWMFPATDTLIQVFPEKFWFDAFLLAVLLTLFEAVVVGIVALGVVIVRRRRQPRRARVRAA
jgi:integral membrane protein (TIGR01906 family)